jgi:short-subunit dehydrogenase
VRKRAIISGASRGIGRAIALQLAQDGYDLAVCSRSMDKLLELKKDVQQLVPECEVYVKSADVADRSELDAFASFATEQLGHVDVLINNAGVFQPGNVHDEQEGQLEKMLNCNLLSAYHLSRSIIPGMKQQKRGFIVNICSVASLKAYPGGGSYGISKYAMLGFSDNLREEMKEFGIRVMAICPGATYTDSWEGMDIDPERLMPASDIANMVSSSLKLTTRSVVENLVIRPQLGDL